VHVETRGDDPAEVTCQMKHLRVNGHCDKRGYPGDQEERANETGWVRANPSLALLGPWRESAVGAKKPRRHAFEIEGKHRAAHDGKARYDQPSLHARDGHL
jgi:hypothetical protein